MWSKYLRRPAQLEKICFAQFAKMYKSSNVKKEDNEDCDAINDDEDQVDFSQEDIVTDDDKFHFIITYNRDEKKIPLIRKKFV